MKAKITTLVIIFLFGLSSVSMAGNSGPAASKKTSKRAARNISMLQDEMDDPYRDNVEVVQKKFKKSPAYRTRNKNMRMLLEEIE